MPAAAAAALLVLNLVGLALAVSRCTKSYTLAKAAASALLVLVLFFLEHLVGLGRPAGLWLPASAASAWLIWRDFARLRANWRAEALFAGVFSYALAWRWLFPDLTHQSEKLTNLTFIRNYLSGARLPPTDAWLPSFPFDFYYSLQHYAAALVGRFFAVDAGVSYHLSFAVLVGLAGLAAGSAIGLWTAPGWRRGLALAAFLAGGTGATVPVHFMMSAPRPQHSVRFIGGTLGPRAPAPVTDPATGVTRIAPREALELPAETFGYLVFLGDYHAPLGGFFLLTLALLAIAALETGVDSRAAPALLAATVPMTLAVDAWNLPLQAALALAWLAHRMMSRERVPWRALGVGALGSLVLLGPFLARFVPQALRSGATLRLVPPGEHTPWWPGLLVLWPIGAVVIAHLWCRERRRETLWLSVLWLGLLALAEFVYLDDPCVGGYNRFNTTLKWWPWIQAGALLTVGPLSLTARSRVARWITVAAMAGTACYAIDLGREMLRAPKPHVGRLDGAAWLASRPAEGRILEYLKRQPPGIVLERLEGDAFLPAPALAMFSGHMAFLGWPAHERLWRGDAPEVEDRRRQVEQFYAGQMAHPLQWLARNRVDFILWTAGDFPPSPAIFERIHRAIEADYEWKPVSAATTPAVGLWSRR